MKRLALGLLLWALLTLQAAAGVPCVLPFTLVNGVTADATQVMANYNQLVTCLQTGAAAQGANNDITSLLGLTTPLPPASGGSTAYYGSTSSGAANAQTISVTSPTGFTLVAGYRVTFIAGFTNTSAMTLAVAGTAATNVYRQTPGGLLATAGGETIAGQIASVIYDGTQFQLVSTNPVAPGVMQDFAGTSAPTGWLLTDGSCQTRATYPALFAVLSTTWDVTSACNVTQFALPDYRGRVTTYKDDMGGSAANRITVAGGNFNGTVLGAVGGLQNHTQLLAEIAAHSHGISDPGHAHTYGTLAGIGGAQSGAGAATVAATSSTTSAAVTGISVSSAGSSTPFTILNPTQIALKIIKF